MSTNGDIDLRTVLDAVSAAVDESVGHQRQITLRPATVRSVSPDQTLVELEVDGSTAITAGDDTADTDNAIGAQVLASTVFNGDRVMVMFVPPAGAFVVGRRGGDFGDWHVVGEEDEPLFETGWGNLSSNVEVFDPAGWPKVMFRRIGRFVELRGRASRISGTAWNIFVLPDGYRPANYVVLPVVTGGGTAFAVGAISITPTGVVAIFNANFPAQSTVSTFLTGVFSVDELPLDMTEIVAGTPAQAAALDAGDIPLIEDPLPRHERSAEP
jgi:hypothetical protein